jgi:hypothetical protein
LLGGGRVSTDQGHGITGIQSHIPEACKHLRNRVIDVGKQPIGGFVSSLSTADPRLDRGSAGADDDSEDTGNLEK